MSSFNVKNDMTWRDFLIRLGIVACAVTIIVWLMPRNNYASFKIELGKPWAYTDLSAPFDFPIYKSDEAVKAERDSLMNLYEPYYIINKDVAGKQIRQFYKDYSGGIPGLSNDYLSIIANRLSNCYTQGIMNSSEYVRLREDSSRMVRLVSGKDATSRQITKLYSVVTAYEQIFTDDELAPHADLLRKCNLNDYITPNLTYDRERSEASLNELHNSIPLASGVVQMGQKIIDRGEIIDKKTYNILQSYQREKERREANQQGVLSITIFGKIVYVFIMIASLATYLTLFRKDYFERMRSAIMLFVLIVFFSVITSMMVSHSVLHVFILPYAMVPIFIRVFMDSRTAFMTHATTVLISAVAVNYQYEFIIIEMASGLAAIYALSDMSKRAHLFKAALMATLCAAAVYYAMQLIINDEIQPKDRSMFVYLAISGVLLLLAYPLMYVIEKLFGFTSNITFFELSDTNQELLRMLSEKAPGTFAHSTTVGNLASEVAKRIGANILLVRTGALYHDIGKMVNPVFFTENQAGVNPHDKLSEKGLEKESARIITSHVTEGLKLAEKYDLPDVITDFIRTHHGKGMAKFFYIQYKNKHPEEEPDANAFAYPGPNPQTREQAILMMTDTVEAATKSLKVYDDESISKKVNELIDAQVKEGFFEECPITFRDIADAKQVLIERLKSLYHTRITYPKDNSQKQED